MVGYLVFFEEPVGDAAAVAIPLASVEVPGRLRAPQLQGFAWHLPVDVRGHALDHYLEAVGYAERRLDRLSSSVENEGGLFGEFVCSPPAL